MSSRLLPRLSTFTAAEFGRRLLDVTVALIGLLCLSPLFVLFALWIKVDSPGPVFYRARRIGLGGQPFRLFKFRSMVTDADKRGPGITTASDSRVTRSGQFLRRTKLDELPQLLNVLRGDMSLVGPRPEDPHYVAQYTPEQWLILQTRPGITSAASLTYRQESKLLNGPNWEQTYRNEVMPAKIAIDLEYLARRTVASDIILILRTVAAIFI